MVSPVDCLAIVKRQFWLMEINKFISNSVTQYNVSEVKHVFVIGSKKKKAVI